MIYKIFAAASGQRAFRKLSPELQKHIQIEILSLTNNPTKGQRLKGEFRFLYSLHTAFAGTQYRIVYEINPNQKEIYIHYVGSRENFYKQVSRIGIKPRSPKLE